MFFLHWFSSDFIVGEVKWSTKIKKTCFFLEKVIRRSISLLLHYFLLTSFSWIFVESLELMINLKYPLKIDRIRLWAYGIYAYAFPLLIVILCLVLSRNSSEDDVFRWIFAIPNLLLMIVRKRKTSFITVRYVSIFSRTSFSLSRRSSSCHRQLIIWNLLYVVFVSLR